jgi:hypothetical protein
VFFSKLIPTKQAATSHYMKNKQEMTEAEALQLFVDDEFLYPSIRDEAYMVITKRVFHG